ncbi:MAG: hypothetical protein ACK56F_24265, partial [bacterium]
MSSWYRQIITRAAAGARGRLPSGLASNKATHLTTVLKKRDENAVLRTRMFLGLLDPDRLVR